MPLYRQAEVCAREGITLKTSTLSGWVGASVAALAPLLEVLRRDVMASDVLHGDDTPVPVLAPGAGKTKTSRLWTYVRDERPYGGERPPAAVFYYSPDRKSERPRAHLNDFTGVLHADGYAGFKGLYQGTASSSWHAGPMSGAGLMTCASPGSKIAKKALNRIGALYDVEAAINGITPNKRQRAGALARDRRSSQGLDGVAGAQ